MREAIDRVIEAGELEKIPSMLQGGGCRRFTTQ